MLQLSDKKGEKIKINWKIQSNYLKDKTMIENKKCKVVIYNYVLCWLYSMTKSIVIALIVFFVFCGILLYWV